MRETREWRMEKETRPLPPVLQEASLAELGIEIGPKHLPKPRRK
jgi:hypothetical protein